MWGTCSKFVEDTRDYVKKEQERRDKENTKSGSGLIYGGSLGGNSNKTVDNRFQ